jgi:molecular chaperone GrpE
VAEEVRVASDEDLEQVRAARDRYRAAVAALEAEFVAYRRRSIRELTAALEEGAAGLVARLLPVLDACEAACRFGATDVARLGAALEEALRAEGVERLGRQGAPFDPRFEEAVAFLGGDGPFEVEQVVQAGYRIRGRLIRPARVVVRGGGSLSEASG